MKKPATLGRPMFTTTSMSLLPEGGSSTASGPTTTCSCKALPALRGPFDQGCPPEMEERLSAREQGSPVRRRQDVPCPAMGFPSTLSRLAGSMFTWRLAFIGFQCPRSLVTTLYPTVPSDLTCQ